MTDKVLTDEEKSALLDGVQSGEVEVCTSNGTGYASVTEFRIPQRAHMVKNSFPRLGLLNQQVAERVRRDTEQLLQADLHVTAGELEVRTFGGICERLAGLAAVIVFEAAPLNGRALVVIEPALVRLLVDAFFGGLGWWLDGKLGTGRALLLAGMLFGIVVAFANFFKVVLLLDRHKGKRKRT